MDKIKASKEFLHAMPKADLHVHLSGSMRITTLIELAKQEKITLPSFTEEGLKELVFKERYNDLEDYLRGFEYTCAMLQTSENLERVAYELGIDSFQDGIRYIEPRFAPQKYINPSLSIEQILEAVCAGLKRAQTEINQKTEIKEGKEPRFAFGIIACAMRMFTEDTSNYYKKFINVHRFSTDYERYALASLELAKAIVKIRDDRGLPIVGFDLAGPEIGFPAQTHKEAYHYVHKNFMKKTVHAGEAFGAVSIFQAITDLHADRIGHATHLFDESMIHVSDELKRKKYIHDLSQYIADRRTTLEICLTSNFQANPNIKHISEHPCKDMLDNRLSVTFCTDNRLVCHTTLTREYELAVENFDIDNSYLKDIVAYGFKRSFFPGEYKEKRDYVGHVLDYYEELEDKLLK